MNCVKLVNTDKDVSNTLETLANFYNASNFNPIYKQIFNINKENCDAVKLPLDVYLKEMSEKISKNIYKITTNKNELKTFIKFCPLVDPLKYLTGSFKEEEILKTPKYDICNDKIQSRINNYNNCAYVDGYFSYLSSILLNDHNFVHGINFYGSYTGIKNKFCLNITDDLDYLMESEYFVNNKNHTYTVLDDVQLQVSDTRKNRDKINISKSSIKLDLDELEIMTNFLRLIIQKKKTKVKN